MSLLNGKDVMPARSIWVFLPWIAAAVGCSFLLVRGFPMGHDWIFELVRVAEYQYAASSGQLPPYWGENLYAGYGSPVYLFYAPLFAAVASVFAPITDSISDGSVLALVFFSIAAVPITHALMRELLQISSIGAASDDDSSRDFIESAARLGTSFYLLHPYLLSDKLLRNASAEFAALCLMPALLYGVLLARRSPRLGFLWISMGLALLVLSHNLSALVGLTLSLGTAVTLHFGTARARVWVGIGSGIAAGLALSFFFWFPAFTLTSLIRTDELLRGKFDFHNQFPELLSVFSYSHFYSVGVVGLAPLPVAAVAAFALWKRAQSGDPRFRFLAAGIVALLLLLFIMTPASAWLWESVPLMPLFQFPWRFLGPFALLSSLLVALSYATLVRTSSRKGLRATEIGAWLLCLANALPTLFAAQQLPVELRDQLPRVLSPASIRAGTQSVSVLDEYLPSKATSPTWRTDRPSFGPVVSVTGDAKIEVVENRGIEIRLSVESESGAHLRIARWAFPGWNLESDEGGELQINELGSLDIKLAPGTQEIRLLLSAPPSRRIGLVFSAVTLLAWLVVWASGLRSGRAS
jgi:hypothetical protein